MVDRTAWHNELADKLAVGSFTLLHAHRQAGKSSAARAVGSILERRGDFCVLACSLESVRPTSPENMFRALASRFRPQHTIRLPASSPCNMHDGVWLPCTRKKAQVQALCWQNLEPTAMIVL